MSRFFSNSVNIIVYSFLRKDDENLQKRYIQYVMVIITSYILLRYIV